MNKTRKSLSVLLGFLLIVMVGCSSDGSSNEVKNPSEKDGEQNQTSLPTFMGSGNTPSNIINGGIASEYDGYIYHIDNVPSGNVWRTNIDDMSSELLVEGMFQSVNVLDGYIFVTGGNSSSSEKYPGEYGIFRFTIEGDDLQLISKDIVNSLTLYNNWLFYSDGGIFKIKSDGSEKEMLLKDSYSPLIVDKDLIIFETYVLNDNQDTYLYTMPIDGGNPELIVDDTLWGGSFYYGNGNIYYFASGDIETFYCVEINGNNKRKVLSFETSKINVTDDYIYAFDAGKMKDKSDQGLYRWDLDHSNRTFLLETAEVITLNVAGGYLLYSTYDSAGSISMVSTEGGEVIILPKQE